MSSYTVEVAGDDVGIVVWSEKSFRFFGVDPRVRALEGLSFSSPEAATRAAGALIRTRHRTRPARIAADLWRQSA